MTHGIMLVKMAKNYFLLSSIFPPRIGGSGRWFWEIYSRIPNSKTVVVSSAPIDSVDEWISSTIERHCLPLDMRSRGIVSISNFVKYFLLSIQVARIFKRQKGATIMHCGRNLPEGFIAYLTNALFGIPYLCYVHGEDISVSSGSRELTWMTNRVLRNATALISNSNNTAMLLKNRWNISSDKIRVLYPGVDTTKFYPEEQSDTRRHQLGWSDRLVMLTVGRLQKRKGQDMLIAALPEIIKNFPTILYVIVGEGEELSYLKSSAQKLGISEYVHFAGALDDNNLILHYQQCDLFLLPNREVGNDIEGFGMVLLEAQACGKVVVAGRSGGTSEAMLNSKTGFVVDCNSPQQVAVSVCRILQDFHNFIEMGIAGRQWVCEHFDWNSLSKTASEYFDSL